MRILSPYVSPNRHVDIDFRLLQSSGGLDGSYPFRVRSMDLNDELGQITHIFSDKTGTLTLNYMEFRKLLIGGVAYGLGTTMVRLCCGSKDTA